MKPFFTSAVSQEILRFHAAEWLGTPFVAHAMVRGVGADCVHLVAAIYLASGFLVEFTPPAYALDSGMHREQSQLVGWLETHPRFLRVDPNVDRPMAGDTLCFNMGLSEHHAGLMLTGGEFIHTLPRRMAIVSSLTERFYSRRITAMFRPMDGRIG